MPADAAIRYPVCASPSRYIPWHCLHVPPMLPAAIYTFIWSPALAAAAASVAP